MIFDKQMKTLSSNAERKTHGSCFNDSFVVNSGGFVLIIKRNWLLLKLIHNIYMNQMKKDIKY